MNYKEIEFKYDAKQVSIDSFKQLVESFNPKKKMLVSSYDDYFVDQKDNYIRYRFHDDWGELTIKRKLNEKNNNERIEVNLPTSGNNLKSVSEFASLLGYSHNFGIFKTCYIYWLDNIVLSYYVVFDKELNEKRRFIEIEADENHNWTSEQEALLQVSKYEELLEPLGSISPRHRMKKSLFEIFKLEPKI
jgi:adenylate cyclase class IV